MKRNMIWFVRELLFSPEHWQNTWQRCCIYCFSLSFFSPLEFSLAYICTLEQEDPKVHTVVEKLLDVLNTPSEAVQRAVSACLSPLMQSKQV